MQRNLRRRMIEVDAGFSRYNSTPLPFPPENHLVKFIRHPCSLEVRLTRSWPELRSKGTDSFPSRVDYPNWTDRISYFTFS
jgi:hypothetical protein